ncbi:hypothetical protein SO802_030786 [Lithocarpus litseifolius]|uniref:RNase H type-1 domain-containing protein n=1 Tax=Lithocarpus litseifolius TaxID=425828 RepID=A0AAW2BIJ4_9ROSI
MINAAWCKYLQGQYSVTETEALAVECGVLLARDMELSHIIIESDALAAIQGILAAETEGSLGHVYQGILSILSSFSSWSIKHVKRDYNRVAHELAQFARKNETSQVWKGSSFPIVQQLVQAECM